MSKTDKKYLEFLMKMRDYFIKGRTGLREKHMKPKPRTSQ